MYISENVDRGYSSAKGSSTRAAERRVADRHIFTAAAEVVELGSGARFSTRTTDLSLGGCFVDTMLPFPVGSKVHVSVRKDRTQFEAKGTVVYSQVGLGMGIAFDPLDPPHRDALDSWLNELTAGRHSTHHEQAPPLHTQRPPVYHTHPSRGGDQSTANRLIHLLVAKGLLTEEEAASILHEVVL